MRYPSSLVSLHLADNKLNRNKRIHAINAILSGYSSHLCHYILAGHPYWIDTIPLTIYAMPCCFASHSSIHKATCPPYIHHATINHHDMFSCIPAIHKQYHMPSHQPPCHAYMPCQSSIQRIICHSTNSMLSSIHCLTISYQLCAIMPCLSSIYAVYFAITLPVLFPNLSKSDL